MYGDTKYYKLMSIQDEWNKKKTIEQWGSILSYERLQL